jgi:hypothetical protein
MKTFIFLVFSCFITLYSLNVDLKVKESTGSSVSQFPVTIVVPLPEGQFHDINSFQVAKSGGNPALAQFSPLTRWWVKDNSIRNLRVSFLADVGANGTSIYTFSDNGSGNSNDNTLNVNDDGSLVTVVTGPLKFTVNKTTNKIFDQVWLDLNSNSQFEDGEKMLVESADQGGILTERDGSTTILCSSLNATQVVVEESGPVRAVIKIETPTNPNLGNYFGYKVRIYAYKGRSNVKVVFTLKNAMQGETGQVVYFDDFSIKLKPNLGSPVNVSYGGSSIHTGALGSGSYLYQSSADSYTMSGSVSGSGTRAQGWVDVSNGSRGVMVAVKEFYQNFKKAMEVTGSGEVYVRLWPKYGEDGGGIYWLGDMQHKTHTLLYYFHGNGETGTSMDTRAKLLDRRPLALVPVSWYAQTRQPTRRLGYMHLQNPVSNPTWQNRYVSDTLGWRKWFNQGRKRTATGGDSPGGWKADHYIVCEDPRWVYRGEAWANHSADIRPTHIDGYTHPMADSWSGFVTGGYDWENWRDQRVPNEHGTTWDGWKPYDSQHAWIFEMEDIYYYNGDRLLFDNLCNLGELWQQPLEWAITHERGMVGCRHFAWVYEIPRIQFSVSGDSECLSLLNRAIPYITDSTFQDPFRGSLNYDTQSYQNGMAAAHLSAHYNEIPPGIIKSKIFGALIGLGDYLCRHAWASNGNGIGWKASNTTTQSPYYNNRDMGDIPPMLYIMTGISFYKQRAISIANNLGSFWTDWRAMDDGMIMSYVMNIPRQDTVPPAAIADLKAYYPVSNNPDTVVLAWTTPQDAKRYDIRSSAKTIVEFMTTNDTASSENWWHCEPYPYLRPAGNGGQADLFLAVGKDIKNHNFLVRSFDSVEDQANLSDFSNLAKPQCCFDPDTLPGWVTEVERKDPQLHDFPIIAAPNPFKSAVKIRVRRIAYSVRRFEIQIYNINGELIENLTPFASRLTPYSITWNATGHPAGVYIIRLKDKGKLYTKRIVLSK